MRSVRSRPPRWPPGRTPTAAVWGLLSRTTPRTTDGAPSAEVVDHDFATAIIDTVRRLDDSYLAVQGPPGTGKTYIGTQVITALLAEGKRIGIVGPSHAVVENMLDEAAPPPGCRRRRWASAAGGGEAAVGRAQGQPGLSAASSTALAPGRASSSAEQRGTSATPIASSATSWTCSSSTRPGSSPWRTPSRRACRRTTSSSSATPSSSPRSPRACIPNRSTFPALGWRAGVAPSTPDTATSSTRPSACTPTSPRRCRGTPTRGGWGSHPSTARRSMVDPSGQVVPARVAVHDRPSGQRRLIGGRG